MGGFSGGGLHHAPPYRHWDSLSWTTHRCIFTCLFFLKPFQALLQVPDRERHSPEVDVAVTRGAPPWGIPQGRPVGEATSDHPVNRISCTDFHRFLLVWLDLGPDLDWFWEVF
jgi:hypothetical protein